MKNKSGIRPFFSWLCFFLGVSIFLTAGYLSVLMLNQNSLNTIEGYLEGSFLDEVQETEEFKSVMIQLLGVALSEVSSPVDEEFLSASNMREDSYNLLYYAVNNDSKKFSTNTGNTQVMENLQNGVLPEGFNYYLVYDGKNLTIIQNSRVIFQSGGDDVDSIDTSGYGRYLPVLFQSRYNTVTVTPDSELLVTESTSSDITYGTTDLENAANCRVYIAVNENPRFITYSYYSVSGVIYRLNQAKAVVIAAGVGIFLGVALLVLYVISRRQKQKIDLVIARMTNRVWFEFKLVFSVIVIASLATVLDDGEFELWLFGLILFWYLALCVNDMRYNPRAYRHNICNSVLRRYRLSEAQKPFQKMLVYRFWVFVSVEAALLLVTIMFLYTPIPIVTLGLMAYLLYRYNRRLESLSRDMGRLVSQISDLRAGNEESPLFFPADADLHQAAEDLSNIQSGIKNAVEEQIRSERMKIELITNVSHDIKTPLTSIIGYVDLLKQEKELPDHVRDYVAILSNKSERLKNMVQDIFDVSKAASGNITLEVETLDLGKLMQQTLADMEEEIYASQLGFRIQIPEEPIWVSADGKRLYRIFQNLIKNALQYSLEGSRVFVTLHVENGRAVAELKNTSRYEIAETTELTERFVRGDQSRSTEGSGLGLSIVKSFAEACGGDFRLQTIADLFCTAVSFPTVPPPTRLEEAIEDYPEESDCLSQQEQSPMLTEYAEK